MVECLCIQICAKRGKNGPKMSFFFVFLDKTSSEFASIAYGNRERYYLAGGSGQSAEKKCWAFVGHYVPKGASSSVELWLDFGPATSSKQVPWNHSR